MQHCNNCGGHVSERFARVFGDNDDEVFACNDCTVLRELFEGSGGGIGAEKRGGGATASVQELR